MNGVLPDGRSIVTLLLAFSFPGNAVAVAVVDVEEISAILSHFSKGQPCGYLELAVLLDQTVL